MLGVAGNTYAGTDQELLIGKYKYVAHSLRYFFHNGRGSLCILHVLRQHHKLISAKAGHRVPLAQGPVQPAGYGYQQLVAQTVSPAVVDVLEIVQIYHDQCKCRS